MKKEGRHAKAYDFRDVDMAKNGESQLNETQDN